MQNELFVEYVCGIMDDEAQKLYSKLNIGARCHNSFVTS